MALFPKTTEIRDVRNGNAVPALGNRGVKLTIPRQDRRLDNVVLYAFVRVTGALTAIANQDTGWDNIMPLIRVKATDANASNRAIIEASSATLLHWHRRRVGRYSRYAKALMAKPTSTGNYIVPIPLWFRDPALSEAIGVRTCVPLSAAEGMGDDLSIEMDFADAIGGTGGKTSSGFSAGTVVIDAVRALITYREMPRGYTYVPTELKTSEVTWANFPDGWDFPNKGILAAFLHEGFSAVTPMTRAEVLKADGTAGYPLSEQWTLKFGRSDREGFASAMYEDKDEDWADAGLTTQALEKGIWTADFMHDTPLGEAMSPGSAYNLYTDNRGDVMRLQPSNVNSASSWSRITAFKYLTTNLQQLLGA